MELRVLESKEEYRDALGEIEHLMDRVPAHGTEEDDRLALLALLAEQYEKERYRLALPDRSTLSAFG